MTEDEVFTKTEGAYLCLIHPVRRDDAYRKEVAPVIALTPSVSDELVAALITGVSWRGRLLGFCIATSKKSGAFVDAMVQSLQNPRGMSIVPTCAALAVWARAGIFAMPASFGNGFDRAAFDGELGWAIDKAKYLVGLRADDVPGRGPNYGQIFEDHVEVYSWIIAH